MATVHFIMQGKGGVGKSLIASLLFQYLHKHGAAVYGCDTDPVNASFACYKAFNVQTLDIMEGDDIDARAFDELIEVVPIVKTKKGQNKVCSCWPCGPIFQSVMVDHGGYC